MLQEASEPGMRLFSQIPVSAELAIASGPQPFGDGAVFWKDAGPQTGVMDTVERVTFLILSCCFIMISVAFLFTKLRRKQEPPTEKHVDQERGDDGAPPTTYGAAKVGTWLDSITGNDSIVSYLTGFDTAKEQPSSLA